MLSNLVLIALAVVLYYFTGMVGLYGIAGVIVGMIIFGLVGIFFKDFFRHDPDRKNKFAYLLEIERGRSVQMTWGGQPVYVLHGDQNIPQFSLAIFGLWYVYKLIVWFTIRHHAYPYYFRSPYVYPLPRYEIREQDGHQVFVTIEEDSPGYRTNHVRTEPSTWYFMYGGVDIQKIPFTVKGSVQIWIDSNMVTESLYKTDAWNVLLTQALNGIVRSVCRQKVTLDKAIGKISKDIWETVEPSEEDKKELLSEISGAVEKALKEYELRTGDKLVDVGIHTGKVDIVDFKDELTGEERAKLYVAIFGREEGRAIHYRGQGTSEAQRMLKDVHADGTGASPDIIKADALRDAAKNDNTLGLLLATIAKNKM